MEEITPLTSTTSNDQKNEPTVRYAGFWIRVLASLIDGLIMFIPSLLLGWLIPIVGGMIIGVMYKVFFESSVLQATPGKALLGLRVTTLEFERISFKKSMIRYVATTLSTLTLGIGFIMAAFTQKKQTLHDILAETVVIRKPPEESVNYIEAWSDEVVRIFTGSGKKQKIFTSLEELQHLRNKGVITEEEFNAKKAEMLAKI